MDPTWGTAPLRPLIGEEQLVVAWLAENHVLPAKTEWGRYTLSEQDGAPGLSWGTKRLVVDNLGIATDERLAEVRRLVLEHPRWKD